MNRDEAKGRIAELNKAADLTQEALAIVDTILAQWPQDYQSPHVIDRAAVSLLVKDMRQTTERLVGTRNALNDEMGRGRYGEPPLVGGSRL